METYYDIDTISLLGVYYFPRRKMILIPVTRRVKGYTRFVEKVGSVFDHIYLSISQKKY